MLIQCLNVPEYSIGEDGAVCRSARWLLCADPTDVNFALAAALWAGEVHGDWRVPNQDGDGYTTDPTVRIARIGCKMLDASSCEITYEGVPRVGAVTRLPGAYQLERRANLEEYQSDTFQVPAKALNAFLPAVGDAVNWNGTAATCIGNVAKEQPDGSYLVTVTAVSGTIRAQGEISGTEDAEFASVKQGVWVVADSRLAAFLAENAVHASAATWAGEGFYIFHQAAVPDERGYTKVTLQARQGKLRLIEACRSEELLSGGADGTAEVIWKSRWRVRPEDRELFSGSLGSDASEWAERGFVVSRVTPKRVSDCEYEYTLEARRPESIVPGGQSIYWLDDDLPDRVEVKLRGAFVQFSAGQCGYCWNYRGQYTLLRNWNPADDCPIVTGTPLNRRWIQQTVPVLEAVVTTYRAGAARSHAGSFIGWHSGGRVVRKTIAGFTGSWLKMSVAAENFTDRRGRTWTRVTEVFRRPPANEAWNTGYWI